MGEGGAAIRVWVGVDKRSAVRADVNGLVEAVVLKDVCLEVSLCVLNLAGSTLT